MACHAALAGNRSNGSAKIRRAHSPLSQNSRRPRTCDSTSRAPIGVSDNRRTYRLPAPATGSVPHLRRRRIRATIPEPVGQSKNGYAATARVATIEAEAYKWRNVVDDAINKLKGHRAIATRYDERGYMFRGIIDVVSIRIWLRAPVPSSTGPARDRSSVATALTRTTALCWSPQHGSSSPMIAVARHCG